MPESAKQRSEVNPIREPMLLAQGVKLTEQLSIAKLEESHATRCFGQRSIEALLCVRKGLAPPAVVFPGKHLHVGVMSFEVLSKRLYLA